MLRMTLRTQNMIRKSLNIFHIRKPGEIRRAILGCVTGVLEVCDMKTTSSKLLLQIFLWVQI